MLKTTELNTFNEWFAWYANYVAIQLLKQYLGFCVMLEDMLHGSGHGTAEAPKTPPASCDWALYRFGGSYSPRMCSISPTFSAIVFSSQLPVVLTSILRWPFPTWNVSGLFWSTYMSLVMVLEGGLLIDVRKWDFWAPEALSCGANDLSKGSAVWPVGAQSHVGMSSVNPRWPAVQSDVLLLDCHACQSSHHWLCGFITTPFVSRCHPHPPLQQPRAEHRSSN